MHFKTRDFSYEIKYIIYLSIYFYIVSTTHANTTSSIDIDFTCDYEDRGFGVGMIYECKTALNITEQETLINNVNVTHLPNKSNMNVEGLYIIGAVYLQKNITTHFPNLVWLRVENKLKNITKNDLESFPKLKHLWLPRNQLQIIEKDLFSFNPELIYISLKQNNISEIDPLVFDNLTNLSILELDENKCINSSAIGHEVVLKLIQESKAKCNLTMLQSIANNTDTSAILKPINATAPSPTTTNNTDKIVSTATTEHTITTITTTLPTKSTTMAPRPGTKSDKIPNEKENESSNAWMNFSIVLGTFLILMFVIVGLLIKRYEIFGLNFRSSRRVNRSDYEAQSTLL